MGPAAAEPAARWADGPAAGPAAVWHDGGVSFFLVFLAVALTGAVFLLGTGRASKVFRGRRGAEAGALRALDDGFDQPVANLPPVLLPADALPSDVDQLRFAVGLRGYRMDQVDQVLEELRDQLAAKDRKIAALGDELGRLRKEQEREPEPEREPEQAP